LNAIKEVEKQFVGVSSVPKGDKIEDGHIRPIIDWSINFGELA